MILLIPSTVLAGLIGQPIPRHDADLLLIEFVADYWDRPIRDQTGVRDYDLRAYCFRGQAQVTHTLNLIGEFGISSFKIQDSTLDIDDSIFWGVGAKLLVFDLKQYHFSFGCGGLVRNLDNQDAHDHDIKVFYREYEAFIGSSFYRFNFVQPYVGILFSSVSGDVKKSNEFDYSISEDTTFGIFAGLEYRLISHLDLGFEYRGAAVNAVTFFVNYYWAE
jgi:hypothetical protein